MRATQKIPKARQSFSKKGPEVRRQELIDATFRCLVKHGVSDTSVRTIADEASLSLGMVRHYFNSKDELLAATYRHLSERLQEQTHEILANTDSAPLSRLVAFIEAGLKPPLLDRDYVRIRFLFFELTHTNETVRAVHEQIYERFENQLLALVQAVADANHRDDANCPMIMRTILTYLKGVWAEWTLSHDDFDPLELVEQVMPFWLAQIGPLKPPVAAQAPRRTARVAKAV
jgi:TetR/AcrR family transcriptional repressor of bet genes